MVLLKTNRSGYLPKQVEDSTITVRELIELLENCNKNDKVFFSNDNGYTYGYINEDTVVER